MFAGWSEILIIASLVLIVWNARRLPQLGQAVGKSFREFRRGLRGENRPVRDVDPL